MTGIIEMVYNVHIISMLLAMLSRIAYNYIRTSCKKYNFWYIFIFSATKVVINPILVFYKL